MKRPGSASILPPAKRATEEDRGGVVISGAVTLVCEAWSEKGVRRYLEDEHTICPSLAAVNAELAELDIDGSLFAVIDGHGGKTTAAFIKNNVANELAQQMVLSDLPEAAGFFSDAQMHALFKKTFERLDNRLSMEMAGSKDGACATVAFLQKKSKVLYVANLGDGRAFGLRTHNSQLHAVPLSDAHKPWVIKEKNRILKAGGTVESGRVDGLLEVSRSFGDLSLKKHGVLCTPSTMKFEIDPARDLAVFLGCDGFWGCWPALEAGKRFVSEWDAEKSRTTISEGGKVSLRKVTKAMVEACLVDHKSQDNVTVLILKVEG